MAPPVLQLRTAAVTFGGRPVFTTVDLALAIGERAALVGRNGSGKSTLLKVLAGLIDLDGGERFVQPGLSVAYLPQEPRFTAATALEHALSAVAPDDGAAVAEASGLLEMLGIAADADPTTLSGGEARRVDLARTLAGRPDVLLLDEPTNHLDLPTIEWLEQHLSSHRGALLMISHDRAFLRALSTRVLWLDRGRVLPLEAGFDRFDTWSEGILEAEAVAADKLDKRIASETEWAKRGIPARRKRNQGRLATLAAMRSEAAGRIRQAGSIDVSLTAAEGVGSLAIEAIGIQKSYGERMVVRDVSLRIARGARLGIVGPNGAGKTTLLRLLTGELEPDQGRVRIGANVEPSTLDQKRAALVPTETPKQSLADRGDTVFVGGRPVHVHTYLRQWLFEDRQGDQPVSALSGGERARLLLAKVMAKPASLLVLDEPTNDLDMDTLDLLQDALGEFPGTVLLVSHDRDFLDRTATSLLVAEGDGRWLEYAGGWSDMLAQRGERPGAATARPSRTKDETAKARQTVRRGLSYKDERERQSLPKRMEALSTEIAAAEAALADPDLYRRDPKRFATVTARLDAARQELSAAEERWLELELMLEQVQS
ncbi:MAG: ATP-binding cassette domain-containing protein [Alphaproteobacteria bacterium]|nr:ATP-binding cassette domain-containing protein [Alphaproteobacteria bacterium]TAD90350.1 MAG: ATP-binding cassette domain-containing protein [Alphaproteobacteria bacterium]